MRSLTALTSSRTARRLSCAALRVSSWLQRALLTSPQAIPSVALCLQCFSQLRTHQPPRGAVSALGGGGGAQRSQDLQRPRREQAQTLRGPGSSAFLCRRMQGRRLFSSLSAIRARHFIYIEDAVTKEEERMLCDAVEPLLKNRRYEKGHWDSVISKYKEIELLPSSMEPPVRSILRRLAEQVLTLYNHGPTLETLLPPHVVDLDADGSISPHVDNIRHSGTVLAGLSLLSPRVMRLERQSDIEKSVVPTPESCIEQILQERSLYALSGPLRYEFAHSILGQNDSPLHNTKNKSQSAALSRRISIIFRDRCSTN